MTISNLDDMRAHVLKAYETGQQLDLDHCVYGPATGGTRGYIDETLSYYRLLAGHCAMTNAGRVMEVGTHYGGSTLALLAGMKAGSAPDPLLVTMDITDLNRERLSQEPEIRKVIGDSTQLGFVASLAGDLPSADIDLLYIDALKDPGFVLTTLHNVDAVGVRPKWLILDDIQTTPEMRTFWDLVEKLEPEMSFLVSREFPHIRKPEMGYGIVYLEGTENLIGRVPELMATLGLSTQHLAGGDIAERYKAVPGIAEDINYVRMFPRHPTETSNNEQLSTLYALAKEIYTGEGDILDVGTLTGATTLALAEGLERNSKVNSKFARITACDKFLYDVAGFERYVKGRVPFNSSVLPIFAETTRRHSDKINTVEMPMNVARWCGRPIEILVAGLARTPQINAHLIAEFVTFMLPGRSLLVQREMTAPYRHWVTYVFAFLADHFELLDLKNGTAVFVYKTPIPPSKVLRIIENRFAIEERAKLVEEYARSFQDAGIRFDLLGQAVSIATKHDEFERANEILGELRSELSSVGSPTRAKSVAKLESLLAKALQASAA